MTESDKFGTETAREAREPLGFCALIRRGDELLLDGGDGVTFDL